MTGEAATAAEPAQVATLSPLEAPKPVNPKVINQAPADEGQMAADAPAAIEMIEPSTGEVIVLSQHMPAAKAKAAVEEQVTPLAKPEKRKNAKQKLKTKPAEDETTPDTTATAKSNAGAKSAEVLAANEARKERKAAAKNKAKAKEKPARGNDTAKAGKGGAKAKKGR